MNEKKMTTVEIIQTLTELGIITAEIMDKTSEQIDGIHANIRGLVDIFDEHLKLIMDLQELVCRLHGLDLKKMRRKHRSLQGSTIKEVKG